jgi:hypothetical protein
MKPMPNRRTESKQLEPIDLYERLCLLTRAVLGTAMQFEQRGHYANRWGIRYLRVGRVGCGAEQKRLNISEGRYSGLPERYEILLVFVTGNVELLPRWQPDMPDQHTEPEDEDDKCRRQLQQLPEHAADRGIGTGSPDDQQIVADGQDGYGQQEEQG